ncbi:MULTISPECIES: histidinol-phosphate transaminase [Brevibacterium]|uniref:Histidinol-phosphate aminotransferase n=2 Tax=Brevibacterium casei TaxID=33889 RepID=K9AJA4_9MICO|nr:histidinol-phosphate transaminase [Brevibacterium casei]NJE66628.1 aminotransferase class I/II-fold pyridoxal phosphate-dependent enzyme [Brevibacterium sp. LS14]EKU47344.1 class I and II aminotransferase [Brevibacterium casei S18]KZE20125.1 aminotransferase [Brevibacterium casei]MBE4694075.1 histidinol-phosphate transaminase [Brevibacterium casei]MBY3577198.1 histidinol-phosphate transaminase [Brevibacterium casei]
MSKRFLLRDALTQFPPYKPGKPPSDAPGLAPYKLSSNENHFAPLPGITEAVAAATQVPAAYPDPKSAKLVAEIAAYLDVDPSEVVPGAGASEILSALTNITLEAGTSVVYPWPSFEMYPILASARGAEKRAVPLLPDGRHDFAGMLAEIDDTTRLVLLCSPNNPTGPSVRTSELDGFMAEVPAGVIVALDEAYWEFATDAEAVDGLAAFRKYDNLVLARTFSKAHGLAGLRVGYGVADAEIATALRQVVAPFSVTTGAQAAASESLARVGEVLVRAKEVAATRDRFAADLRDLGFDVPDAQGNYVWIALDDEAAAAFEDACAAQAVAIRRLSGGVRVSIGADEALDRVRAVAREFAAR